MKFKKAWIGLVAVLAGCATEDSLVNPKSIVGDVELISSLPSRVQETSGLAKYDGTLWTINDSGDGAYVYALSPEYSVDKRVRLIGAKNVDWESLAQDKEYLYVADCGNNLGHRSAVQIYKVRWHDLVRADDNSAVPSDVLNVNYADYEGGKGKHHNFDCEALAVVGDELWLFTKNRGDQQSKLYRLDASNSNQSVSAENSYPVAGLITAADYDPVTNRVALLGYGKNVIFGQSFVWIVPVSDGLDWSKAMRIKLHPYAQWEALMWGADINGSYLLLTSERSPLLDVSLGRLPLPDL